MVVSTAVGTGITAVVVAGIAAVVVVAGPLLSATNVSNRLPMLVMKLLVMLEPAAPVPEEDVCLSLDVLFSRGNLSLMWSTSQTRLLISSSLSPLERARSSDDFRAVTKCDMYFSVALLL